MSLLAFAVVPPALFVFLVAAIFVRREVWSIPAIYYALASFIAILVGLGAIGTLGSAFATAIVNPRSGSVLCPATSSTYQGIGRGVQAQAPHPPAQPPPRTFPPIPRFSPPPSLPLQPFPSFSPPTFPTFPPFQIQPFPTPKIEFPKPIRCDERSARSRTPARMIEAALLLIGTGVLVGTHGRALRALLDREGG